MLKYLFEEKKEKNKTSYKFVFENLKKHKGESTSESYLFYAPHIKLVIDHDIDKNNQKIQMLHDPQSLYDFNYPFISKLKGLTDSDLKKTIDSISNEVTTVEDKAKRIYYWVKKTIKYIAFESGFQGYIPREADDIFTKKYGEYFS